jgi:hypothetical protein
MRPNTQRFSPPRKSPRSPNGSAEHIKAYVNLAIQHLLTSFANRNQPCRELVSTPRRDNVWSYLLCLFLSPSVL